jgi:hypothetical protein
MCVEAHEKRYDIIMQTDNELEEDTDEDIEEADETLVSIIQGKEEIVSLEEDEDFSIAVLTPEERESRRTQNRPEDWLKPAIVDGKFTLKKGDFLVMERKLLTQESRPWLDTKCYEIISEPTEAGDMRLLECIRRCNALLNWKKAIEYGYDMRCPPKGKNPETLFQSHGKRRRRRRFVKPVEHTENSSTAQLVSSDIQNTQKRGRGRPKGSKNRSQEEITASKTEYRQHLREKRERRKK